jgi:hypothetical protein
LIREGYTAQDEDAGIGQIVDCLAGMIDGLGLGEESLRICYSNGEATLTATRLANHLSGDITGIVGLFERIALVAPGSYGLLYLYDDEDGDGRSNEFQAFVLSRGQFRRQQDPFLSPYRPMVED